MCCSFDKHLRQIYLSLLCTPIWFVALWYLPLFDHLEWPFWTTPFLSIDFQILCHPKALYRRYLSHTQFILVTGSLCLSFLPWYAPWKRGCVRPAPMLLSGTKWPSNTHTVRTISKKVFCYSFNHAEEQCCQLYTENHSLFCCCHSLLFF